MLRSIKSGQRKVRIMCLKVDATGLIATGLDGKKLKARNEASPVAGQFKMDIPFARDVSIFHENDKATGGTVTISGKELTVSPGSSDHACEVLIIGSDTEEQY